MSIMRFIGYDKNGEKVWQDGRGRVAAADCKMEALEGRMEQRADGKSLDEVGMALDDYERRYGPITPEPPE